MTQVRLKCKICGKEETIEIVTPKRFDPENDIEFRHGKCVCKEDITTAASTVGANTSSLNTSTTSPPSSSSKG